MQAILSRTITAAGLSALLLAAPLAAAPALAQGTAPQGTTAQGEPQVPPNALNEEKLRSFAAATLEVESLNEAWSPRIAAATDPSEQEEVRTQAMEQMAEAVRDKGLSVEEYNTMVQVVQADPQVASTVEAYRDEMR